MTIFGYLMTMFAGMFWVFRLLVAMFATMEKTFMVVPLNLTVEIILLFVNFICIMLVLKKKMFAAIIYMIANFAYFGVDLYNALKAILEEGASLQAYPNFIFSVIGVILPFLIFANIGLNSGTKSTGDNKKTDWFYKSKEHDRLYDERADRNQYKF